MFWQICTQTPDTTSGPFSSLSLSLPSLLFHYPISGPMCPLESLPPCKLWQSLTRGTMRQARPSVWSSQRLGFQKFRHRALGVHVSCPRAETFARLSLQGYSWLLWSVTLQSQCLKLQGSKWELSEQLSQITKLEGAHTVSAPSISAEEVSKALQLADKCYWTQTVSHLAVWCDRKEKNERWLWEHDVKSKIFSAGKWVFSFVRYYGQGCSLSFRRVERVTHC